MTKKKHPIIMFMLLLCLLAGQPCTVALAQEPSPAEAPDPYLYRYEGNRVETSTYNFDFRWVYPSGGAERWRGRNHTMGLFELVRIDGAEEPIAAYCADFIMSAQADSLYRRLNLEDCTYFPAPYAQAMAGHIRGIFNHGYWHDWTDADLAAAEAAANEWLIGYEGGTLSWEGTDAPLPGDTEDLMVEWTEYTDGSRTPIEPISGLTADQALAATQLAIWAFANTEGDGYWVDYRSADGTEFPKNILAFRKYLLHQSAEPLTPENLLFSDDCFTSAKAAITTGSQTEQAVTTYDITLFFKLAGTVTEEDDLYVTAAPTGSTPVTAALNDLTPTPEGYYTLHFTALPAEAVENPIHLTLSGSQMVNGVCFYQAQPTDQADERDASQNLVGKAQGLTPVRAETDVPVTVGRVSASVSKLDGGLPPANDPPSADSGAPAPSFAPLSGVTFDLYVRLDGDYVPVKRGLVTDAEGTIALQDLAEGYTYYLKEAAVPDGYAISDAYHQLLPGETISIVNDRLPVVPDAPPVTPPGGDTPDEASWRLTGRKTLDGQGTGGYTFRMTCPDGKRILVRSERDGFIPFPRQYFSQNGTYTYTFSEVAGEDTAILYDPVIYTAEVTVAGSRVTGVTLRKDGEPVEMDSLLFANTTAPAESPSPTDPPVQSPEVPAPEDSPAAPAVPAPPSMAQVPATGDAAVLWQGPAILSATAVLTLAAIRRRKHQE